MSGAAKAEADVIRGIMAACEDARKFHGWSIERLAGLCGISPRQLRYVRNGKPTSLRRLLTIAHTCGLKVVIQVQAKRLSVEDTQDA